MMFFGARSLNMPISKLTLNQTKKYFSYSDRITRHDFQLPLPTEKHDYELNSRRVELQLIQVNWNTIRDIYIHMIYRFYRVKVQHQADLLLGIINDNYYK